eukprot:Skav215893  [mRNA]  locus=scaffold956:220150:223429:- [translate_table: standard]
MISGNGPLALAAQFGHVEIVDLLLAAGASVLTQNTFGRTPLHLAMSCAPPEVAKKLLSARAAVDAKTPAGRRLRVIAARGQGMTPLHCGADKGHLSVVKQLLAARAIIDATSSRGHGLGEMVSAANNCLERRKVNSAFSTRLKTALHWSSASGRTDVVKLLLQAGASMEAKDEQGQSLVRSLCFQLKSCDVARWWLMLGCFTPCDIATMKGHAELIELFGKVRPSLQEAYAKIQELEKRLEEVGMHEG